jgi:putative peptidoglycan lipid II flippase
MIAGEAAARSNLDRHNRRGRTRQVSAPSARLLFRLHGPCDLAVGERIPRSPPRQAYMSDERQPKPNCDPEDAAGPLAGDHADAPAAAEASEAPNVADSENAQRDSLRRPEAASATAPARRVAASPLPPPIPAPGVGPSVSGTDATRAEPPTCEAGDGPPAAPASATAQAAGAAQSTPAHSRAGRVAGSLARTTTIVTVAVLMSRLLGFLRDTSLSDRFGAGGLADAYVVAATVPLLIFGVVGQALPTIFIPQYTRVLRSEGIERARDLANNINTTLTAVALVLMTAMWFLAPTVVDLVAPGVRVQSPQEALLAASLVRVMIPIIVFYLWSAVMQGILNVHGHFLAPAAMGVPQNLTIIAAIFIGSHFRNGIEIVAWGAMVGTAFTFLIQLPPLHRTGFRFRLRINLHDPLLRHTVVLAGPVVVASVFSQLGVTIDRILASSLPVGAIAAIYYATRLQQFTYAVVGLAIATVLFPQLSAHAGTGSLEQFKSVATRGLRLLSLVALPITVAAFAFHYAIMRVIFQHGVFSTADTQRAGLALLGFTPGILTFAYMDYLMRAFYALQNTRVPMIASVVSVLINIAGDFALVGIWQQAGLTLASSIAWGTASAVLVYRLRRDLGPLGGRETIGALLRMLAAAAVGVAPAYGVYALWVARFAGGRFLYDAIGLLVAALIALAIYLLALGWLRVPELDDARRLATGALRRFGLAA